MRNQRGATLIEVLVSVLVLAIGLLGLAATQVMSMKNANGSHHRYMAALAAQEIIERMRANPAGTRGGAYNVVVTADSNSPQSCNSGSGCTVAQLAALDAYEWGLLLSSNLPDATGTITRVAGVVKVEITWSEQNTGGTGGGPVDATFVMSSEL